MHYPSLAWQERQSNSSLIESVWTFKTPKATSRIVLADPCISLILVKHSDTRVILAGPTTRPRQEVFRKGYACIAIRFKVGVFIKGLPAQRLANNLLEVPADANGRFLLGERHWQFPDFTQVELLVGQMQSLGYLGCDTAHSFHTRAGDNLSSRTRFRHFQHAIGLSPYKLYQLQRMYQAFQLLKNGVPAIDVASELNFVDQSHLTRVSKHFFGCTPGQLLDLPQKPYR